jgi:hypothetical protein
MEPRRVANVLVERKNKKRKGRIKGGETKRNLFFSYYNFFERY